MSNTPSIEMDGLGRRIYWFVEMVPLARYQGCVVSLLDTVNETLGVVNQHNAVQRLIQREYAIIIYYDIKTMAYKNSLKIKWNFAKFTTQALGLELNKLFGNHKFKNTPFSLQFVDRRNNWRTLYPISLEISRNFNMVELTVATNVSVLDVNIRWPYF